MTKSEKLKEHWKVRRLTFVPPMKGKKMSEASRLKMSEAARRRPSNRLGKPHSEESRKRISEITRERTARGPAHYLWKHGKKQRNLEERRAAEVDQWRRAVFVRDRYTCQDCGDNRGRNLQAHHLKPWAEFPELRFEVSNGLTLCKSCHRIRHSK